MPFIGNQPTSGRFIELDSLSASATANYTLQLNSANFSPESVNNLLVSINGVIQGSSTMSLNGAVLTVGATLSSSDTIDFVRVFGNVGTVSTPTDGSVTANKIGTGAVTSAKIADGTIVNADINASAGIAGSKLGTGAVLQVKSTTVTAITAETTNQSFTDIAGMSVSITPKSTSSNVLVSVNLCWGTSSTADIYGAGLVLRDNTIITQGDALGTANSLRGSFTIQDVLDVYKTTYATFQHLDEAISTTSEVTYKVQWAIYDNIKLWLNRPNNINNYPYSVSGTSSITVTEIGG